MKRQCLAALAAVLMCLVCACSAGNVQTTPSALATPVAVLPTPGSSASVHAEGDLTVLTFSDFTIAYPSDWSAATTPTMEEGVPFLRISAIKVEPTPTPDPEALPLIEESLPPELATPTPAPTPAPIDGSRCYASYRKAEDPEAAAKVDREGAHAVMDMLASELGMPLTLSSCASQQFGTRQGSLLNYHGTLGGVKYRFIQQIVPVPTGVIIFTYTIVDDADEEAMKAIVNSVTFN